MRIYEFKQGEDTQIIESLTTALEQSDFTEDEIERLATLKIGEVITFEEGFGGNWSIERLEDKEE